MQQSAPITFDLHTHPGPFFDKGRPEYLGDAAMLKTVAGMRDAKLTGAFFSLVADLPLIERTPTGIRGRRVPRWRACAHRPTLRGRCALATDPALRTEPARRSADPACATWRTVTTRQGGGQARDRSGHGPRRGPSVIARAISEAHAKLVARTGGVIGAWPSGFNASFDEFVDNTKRLIDVVGIDSAGPMSQRSWVATCSVCSLRSSAERYLTALMSDRTDRAPSPCSTPPRSPARTSAAHHRTRRPQRSPATASSIQR